MQYFEIMVDLIQRLNRGERIILSEYNQDDKPTSRTIKNYLNHIKKYFLKESLRNNHGTWYVKNGFLKILGLSAEELAVLVDMLHKAENHTEVLKEIKENIVRDFSNKLLTEGSRDEQEKISTPMKIAIQTLNNAIKSRKKVSMVFNGFVRIIQPCQIFTREYYWYLGGYEEEKIDQKSGDTEYIKKMKTYSINKIKRVKVEDKLIDYDFTKAKGILKYALNGYISWESEPTDVHLLVHDFLANNIDRAGVYQHWTRINLSSEKEGYILYKTKSVHSEFKDIIPTIMKHAPEIYVREPLALMEAVYKQTQNISNIFVNQLPRYDS